MSRKIEKQERSEQENFVHLFNKEIEPPFRLSENLSECNGTDGINVEYVGKRYCIGVESKNSQPAAISEASKEVATGSMNRRCRNNKGRCETANPKAANDKNTGYIHNGQIKKESESIQIDSHTVEAVEEIYEFDELEEEHDGGTVIQDDKNGIVLLKLLPTKPEVSHDSRDSMPHSCPHCIFKAPKRYMLSRHMKSHSDERPYVCSVCDRGFKTNHTLQNHINVHLGNKPHGCSFCESRFTTPGDLARHIRYKHTHDKRHKCTECSYATVELSKLRRHMRAHTGERPYQCPHCTYASADTFKLKRHLRTHTGEKPYECDICQSRFTQANSLKAHKLIHSVDDKPVFQCALCPTTCSRKSDLRIHVQKLHYSDKPFPCKRCGRELPDRYSYKMHVKTHEGERCYSCDQCIYKSISRRNLEIHQYIHSNEKPFSCDICGQTFRQKQLLGRHMNLYHTAGYVPPPSLEKIHNCPYCARSFAHKGNMVRHMQKHDSDGDKMVGQRIRQPIAFENAINSDEMNVDGAIFLSDNNDGDNDEEKFEEYEVLDTMETEDVDDDYVIVETVQPKQSEKESSNGKNDSNKRTQLKKIKALIEIEEDKSNLEEVQKVKSLIEIEEEVEEEEEGIIEDNMDDRNEVQTKKKYVERILDEESSDVPGFMVELDDDDNCVILRNMDDNESTSKNF